MPTSVLWVCLVAVWLFVLVPMVIKGRPQMKKSTDAAKATRLLHRGGTRARTTRRRRAAGAHPHDPEWKSQRTSSRRAASATAVADDSTKPTEADGIADSEETVDAEETTVATSAEPTAADSTAATSTDDADLGVGDTDTDEGHVLVGEVEGPDAEAGETVSEEASPEGTVTVTRVEIDIVEVEVDVVAASIAPTAETDGADEEFDAADEYDEVAEDDLDDDAEYDDAEYDDDFDDDAEYDDFDEDAEYDDDFDEDAEYEDDLDAEYEDDLEDDADYDDLSDDDLPKKSVAASKTADDEGEHKAAKEPKPDRKTRRRSAYTIDASGDALRYKERQRVTLTLLVFDIAAIVCGVMFGLYGWIATGVTGVMLLSYLFYLRRTVKAEHQIRAQRIARARRSAQADAERRRREERIPEFAAAPPPQRLRRPGGAVVLEIDDEDPVFDHLPPVRHRHIMDDDFDYPQAQAG